MRVYQSSSSVMSSPRFHSTVYTKYNVYIAAVLILMWNMVAQLIFLHETIPYPVLYKTASVF
jgi:xanthine/uracil permease